MIIWGLGLMEMMLARRLARSGFTVLQIRVQTRNDRDAGMRNDLIDARGTALNDAAMDHLASRHDVRSFVLMGNCADANVCFNTARVDQRVAGLVLTNPHFNAAESSHLQSLTLLLRRKFWHRPHGGPLDVRRRVAAFLGVLAAKARGQGAESVRRAALASGAYHGGDALLAPEFDRQLRAICARGARVMMVCTRHDVSHRHFMRAHARLHEELRAGGQLHYCVIESGAHVFNDDEDAALHRNGMILQWLDDLGNRGTAVDGPLEERREPQVLVPSRP